MGAVGGLRACMLACVVLHLHAGLAIAHVQSSQSFGYDPCNSLCVTHSSSALVQLHHSILVTTLVSFDISRQEGSCRVTHTCRTSCYTQETSEGRHAASFVRTLLHHFDRSHSRCWHSVACSLYTVFSSFEIQTFNSTCLVSHVACIGHAIM